MNIDDIYVEIMKNNSHNGFKPCYFDAGGFGDFKGEVIEVKKDRYLFKRIFVEYTYGIDVCEDKEDHVWIFDIKELKKASIKKGDCVSFLGKIEPYRRKNGSYDLGITNVDCVEKIESYELPTDEELYKRFLERLKCETCLFTDHCDGLFCMLPQ